MFLRQLQLIVSALTCSLSAICAFLYQLPLLKLIAILGSLWSIYACYKIFSFNNNKLSKNSNRKEDPETEQVSKRKPEIFLHNHEVPNNINKKPPVVLKQEPVISKNLKRLSEI
mgnify:CR=1 FL=1|tara:strand:+ start:238 stop:579 length:342 start_codon:yes stop_codon:yes gene_type:complete